MDKNIKLNLLKKLERIILNKLRSWYLENYQRKASYFQTTTDEYSFSENIKSKILLAEPLMVSRFGSTEFACLEYIYNSKISYFKQRMNFVTGFTNIYYKNLKHEDILISDLCNSSGFFPNKSSYLNEFYDIQMNDLKDVDILGVWLKENVFRNELKNKQLIKLEFLEPYYSLNPWTEALLGKKVLVIHPFSQTIQSQYQKRHLLFKDQRILPEFHLQTIKAVQTIVNTRSNFNTWFEALNHMKNQISNCDFDVAIIGCGAYGFPLAAHVKRMGKVGIHLGGATQILFGIKGKRWESIPAVSKLINEHWVKPLPEETPSEFRNMEDGAYW